MQDNDKQSEQFHYNYLPAPVAAYFQDALGCYRHGLAHAFAVMCRLTVQAVFAEQGESFRLKLFDQVEETSRLANVDDHIHRQIRDILFGTDTTSLYQADGLSRETTAVLLEIMKDILQQTYIRHALLRQKLKMRRFFATQSDEILDAETTNPKVSQFKRPTGTG
ncbi:MAG: hypothetical protein GY727_01470 [Gammaproteobacteria bacterium]|nr:hypothetical protein [Gammaproteobacteria bacterium]MCP4088919.1 hypothetical protein [Gammaproteobacteria bacterium]MCP4274935.1 hypothetical protein [Gammaproteobacteria bacterium]MCP4831998.1 hypothetical protein [Gammaproteobacteria bacterium]MCP4929433.1 hypothetical protein [Gammaproteobacteria bacterium]